MRYAVYRYYDINNKLLYVGATVDVHSRNRVHMNGAEWRDWVDHATIKWYGSKEQAAAVEEAAIRNEKPRFNKGNYFVGAGRPRIGEPPRPRPWEALGMSQRTWQRRRREAKA